MEITRLSAFSDTLAKINNETDKTLFFRGHSNKAYTLRPTLYRTGNYYQSEHKIFREIILNCPQDFSNCKSSIEILVKMQHYGVPTRILDLSRNALTALFFALTISGEYLILLIKINCKAIGRLCF